VTSVAAQASWRDGDGVGDRGSGDGGEDIVGDAVLSGLRGDGAEERAWAAVRFANPM
jgi:hypothetical protein